MMKRLLQLLCIGGVMTGCAHATDQTAYDLSFTAIDDSPMPLSAYRGKVLLVVNTASECGFTPQYEGLEKLYQTYKDQGLVVLGVPSNDFGGQEPGSNAEIKQFCEMRQITFPLTGKQVVSGDDAHPFYQWAGSQVGVAGRPKWNFHKYLIGRDGALLDYFHSTTKPDSDALKEAIEKALSVTLQ